MMLKSILFALALITGAASTATAATGALATGNVNLRAGPSTAYPVVTMVPAGTGIVAHGCLAGYTWCDIGFGAYRGWVSARYIQIVYNGGPVILSSAVAPAVGVAVVGFSQAYWHSYYAAYPWYGSWARYYRPYPGYPVAPRVASHEHSVTCADGSCTGTRSTTGYYGGSTSQTRTCAGGECTATRNTVGRYGNTASRVRNCSANDHSCSVTRTGPRGGTATRFFGR